MNWIAVGIVLHRFHLWRPGVISWTPNCAAAALLASVCHDLIICLIPWIFVCDLNIKYVLRTLDLDLWPPVCVDVLLVCCRKLFLKACVFLHRRSTLSLTGIFYTQIRANVHPTVHERKPEPSIQHIAHKTSQLLSAQSVCEWVCTLAPTGIIFIKNKQH